MALIQAAVASSGKKFIAVRDIETEVARVALIDKNRAIEENLGSGGEDDHMHRE